MITFEKIESYEFSKPIANARNPRPELEAILKGALSPDPLTCIQNISLYHIACVSGRNNEKVIFQPEFLYVLDLGSVYYAGIDIPYRTADLGDPTFPDFSLYQLFSIEGWSNQELLLPFVAGNLLIGVDEGTSETDVIKETSTIARNVVRENETLYKATVKPFDEPKAIEVIEAISFVRYARLNRTIRAIGFHPGWRVTPVL